MQGKVRKLEWEKNGKKDGRTEKFHQIQAKDSRETKRIVAGQGSARTDSGCAAVNCNRLKRVVWN